MNDSNRQVQTDTNQSASLARATVTAQTIGQTRGISDEIINDLVNSSGMLVDDVRASADWSVMVMQTELKKRGVSFRSATRKHGRFFLRC